MKISRALERLLGILATLMTIALLRSCDGDKPKPRDRREDLDDRANPRDADDLELAEFVHVPADAPVALALCAGGRWATQICWMR